MRDINPEDDLQLVFAADNTSTHAMSKCNGGSLVDDQGFHATVNISGSCGGGEVINRRLPGRPQVKRRTS